MADISRFHHKAIIYIEAVIMGAGRTVSWLTAAMATVTTAVVLFRLLFGAGSVGAQESVIYMHALVIMLASAYTYCADAHVRVDIFYRHMSDCQRAWVNALGTALFLLPFAVFTVLICWNYVAVSWTIRETSVDAGGIPGVFLLKSLLLVNGALLFLQGIADLSRSLVTISYADGTRTHG